MHFLNFITAAQSLLNFKLSNHLTAPTHFQHEKNENSAFSKVTNQDVPYNINQNISQKTDHYDTLMEERQKLINQYLQINIQLLQKTIHDNEKTPEDIHPQEITTTGTKEKESQGDSNKKKIKKINHCGHEDKGHYAKGMCSNCYHRYGRVKRPWNCSHQKLYAAGMCQNCYINDYNRKRREQTIKSHDEIKDDQPTGKPIDEIAPSTLHQNSGQDNHEI